MSGCGRQYRQEKQVLACKHGQGGWVSGMYICVSGWVGQWDVYMCGGVGGSAGCICMCVAGRVGQWDVYMCGREGGSAGCVLTVHT